MADTYQMTGAVALSNGIAEVGHDGANVVLLLHMEFGLVVLDPEVREEFQRLFMEAERQAEAWATEQDDA